jgi:hypothetical protein
VDRKISEKIGELAGKSSDRREFLKQASKLAATVPAVALLLSANATPAQAFGRYGRGCGHGHSHGSHSGRGYAYGHGRSRGRSAFGHSHHRQGKP